MENNKITLSSKLGSKTDKTKGRAEKVSVLMPGNKVFLYQQAASNLKNGFLTGLYHSGSSPATFARNLKSQQHVVAHFFIGKEIL